MTKYSVSKRRINNKNKTRKVGGIFSRLRNIFNKKQSSPDTFKKGKLREIEAEEEDLSRIQEKIDEIQNNIDKDEEDLEKMDKKMEGSLKTILDYMRDLKKDILDDNDDKKFINSLEEFLEENYGNIRSEKSLEDFKKIIQFIENYIEKMKTSKMKITDIEMHEYELNDHTDSYQELFLNKEILKNRIKLINEIDRTKKYEIMRKDKENIITKLHQELQSSNNDPNNILIK